MAGNPWADSQKGPQSHSATTLHLPIREPAGTPYHKMGHQVIRRYGGRGRRISCPDQLGAKVS